MSKRNDKFRDKKPPAELVDARTPNAPDEAVARAIPPATNDPTRKINNPATVEAKFAESSVSDAPTLGLPENVAANRLAILESPSYQLAEIDVDFLSRKENRPLRMQLELLKTETLLREHHIDATVVVFGGTQIMPREQAEAVLREATAQRQEIARTIQKWPARSSEPNGSWPNATSTTKPASSAGLSPPQSKAMAAASSSS